MIIYVQVCQTCSSNLYERRQCRLCGWVQKVPEDAREGDVIDFGDSKVTVIRGLENGNNEN